MKLKKNVIATALALSLVAGIAYANTSESQPPVGPGHGQMMNGQKGGQRGPGMMMGRDAMMGDDQGGCSMMNGQYPGTGQMMMQGGRGMHRGGAMMNPQILEKRNQLLDATVELRKQIQDKQFAYVEATRKSTTTQGELRAQEKELYGLRQELLSKRQEILNAK